MFKQRLSKKLALLPLWLVGLLTLQVQATAAVDDIKVDPTAPLFPKSSNSSEIGDVSGGNGEGHAGLQLNSILIRDDDRVAVINSKRVRVGEKIGGAVISQIESDKVTLKNNGSLQVLELYKNSVKTPILSKD